MSEVIWLWLAALAALAGMAWLALSMDVHWRQVVGRQIPRTAFSTKMLRLLGATGLSASLVCCLKADHASMAALVWIMLLAASASSVSMVLTWCAPLLRYLLPRGRNAKYDAS